MLPLTVDEARWLNTVTACLLSYLSSLIRSQLGEIADLRVLEDELLDSEASCDLDTTQVLTDVSATGTSG